MTPKYIAELLGIEESSLPPVTQVVVQLGRLSLKVTSTLEQRDIMLKVMKHIDSDEVKSVSEGAVKRAALWNRCYGEMDPGGLPPFLVKELGDPIRLNGRYETPESPHFEADFLAVVRSYLFDRFFTPVPRILEFGCGSGHNLLALARQFSGKKALVGLDWSSEAVGLVNKLREKHGHPVRGRHFDFFDPDRSIDLGRGDGVLTIGALEQVGKRWESFLSVLLYKKPDICVHLEPIVELYDESSLFDYLAAKYHRKRGYLEGFLPALRAFERRGSVEILAAHRIPFGSLYHEAYSFVAWRPR